MTALRLIPLSVILSLVALAPAQRVTKIKRGSSDFRAIIQEVTPYANAHAAFPVRVPGDTLRRWGDWAFLSSSLRSVDPKDRGDGTLIALLKKGRKWTIREIALGTAGLDQLEAQWAKKHALPKGFAAS